MERTPRRVCILSVHPGSVAATRLRALQYVDAMTASGMTVRDWSFLRERDLKAWYGVSQMRRLGVLLRAMLRLPTVLLAARDADVILVQREALPLGPPVVERWLSRARPLVWDVDDAVWQLSESPTAGRVPAWIRSTPSKQISLCHLAAEVWAGSEVLADWCRRYSDNVVVVPTVVPVPAVRPPGTAARSVGWIGSHSTGPFLESVLPAVARVQPPAHAIVVGASVPAVRGLDLDLDERPWSLVEEERSLAEIRVGLYPIDVEHPLAEGKCGLKAILYMSRGIPAVVTPTPTNCAVVTDEVTGLYADSDGAWTSQVERLLNDEALWERLSSAGHERALTDFSLQVWTPRVLERLSCVIEQRVA